MNWKRLTISLLMVAGALPVWTARRDGRMGIFVPEDDTKVGKDDLIALWSRQRMCCVGDIRYAFWDGVDLRLDSRRAEPPSAVPPDSIVLTLGTGVRGSRRSIPWSEAAFFIKQAGNDTWVADPQRRALLQIGPNTEYSNVLANSAVGRIVGIFASRGSTFPQFWLTTREPNGIAAVWRYQSNTALSKLNPEELAVGEDAKASFTGITPSGDGQHVYAIKEREGELFWLDYKEDPAKCAKHSWCPSILARFTLPLPARGRFRGLVMEGHTLIGSGPGGLYYVRNDGKLLGRIETDEEISWLFHGYDKRGERQLFAVAGQCIWTVNSDPLNLK